MSNAVQDPALEAAVKLHQSGRINRAADAYRKIIQDRPQHAHALHLLGVTQLQSGHYESAVEYISKAVEIEPNIGTYHVNLAAALRLSKRIDDAIAAAEKAIALDPAVAAKAYHIAALAFIDGKQPADAVHCWEKALQADPDFAAAHLALARLLKHSGQTGPANAHLEVASKLAREWIAREPESVEARLLLARCHEQAGRQEDAIAEYRQATKLAPHDIAVFLALGRALQADGQVGEAITCLRFALRMDPNVHDTHVELGTMLLSQKRPSEAANAVRQAIRIQPSNPRTHDMLARALYECGDTPAAVHEARTAMEMDLSWAAHGSTFLRLSQADASTSAQALYDAHCAWTARYADRLSAAIKPFANQRDPERVLRIGLMAPDCSDHDISRFVFPFLSHIDPAALRCIVYSNDERRPTNLEMFPGLDWQDVAALSDSLLVEHIRHDAIDILIDLAGHAEGNRLFAYSMRAAPIQMTQFGYPGSTGLTAIDYRISDQVTDPPGLTEQWHSEKLERLAAPWCFVPWEEERRIESRANTPPTFGCVAEAGELSGEVLKLWTELIGSVDGARLIVLATSQDVEATLQRFTKHGFDAARVSVLDPRDPVQRLDVFNRFDVTLDAFPLSSATRTCDSLWMGVPVVTLAGKESRSRRSAGVLAQVGLHDLIAETPADYMKIAAALAIDRPRLAGLRQTLRDSYVASPMGNPKLFAIEMQSFLRRLWREYAASGT